MRKLFVGLKNILFQNNIDFKNKNHCFKNMILFSVPLLLTSYLELATTFIVFILMAKYTTNPDLCISAISSSFNVLLPIVNLFIGISIGINYEVAKAVGSGDHEKIKKIFYNATLLLLILGTIIAIAGFFSAEYLLKAISTPSSYIKLSTKFTQIYFLYFPLILGINFYESLIIGEGNSKAPFIFSICFVLLNTLLAFLFLKVAKLDFLGTAYSKLICNAIQFVFYLVIILSNNKVRIRFKFKELKFYLNELKEMFIVGLAIGLSCFLITFSRTISQREIHGFGEVIIFGTAIANFYLRFLFNFIDTIGICFATIFGHNISSEDRDFKKKIIKNGVILTVLSYLVLGSLILFLRKQLLSVFLNETILSKEDCVEAIKFANRAIYVNLAGALIYGASILITNFLRIKKKNYFILLVTLISFVIFKIIFFIIINNTITNYNTLFYLIMTCDVFTWLLFDVICGIYCIKKYKTKTIKTREVIS